MLIVSAGTGTSPDVRDGLNPAEMNLLFNASTIPSALMLAALTEQDLLCRVFGDCLAGDPLDREIDTLMPSAGPLAKEQKLFTYLRYNAELTRADWTPSAATRSRRRSCRSSTPWTRSRISDGRTSGCREESEG